MSDSVPPQDPPDGSSGAGPAPDGPAADSSTPDRIDPPPVPSAPAPAAPPPAPMPASVPPPVGYPPQQIPYGAPAAYPAPDNGMGTAALVLGIVGLVGMCAYGFGVIPAILAIIFGKIGMNKVAEGTANNLGSAKAGFIMGIVGVALAVIGVLIVLLVVIVAAMADNPALTGR